MVHPRRRPHYGGAFRNQQPSDLGEQARARAFSRSDYARARVEGRLAWCHARGERQDRPDGAPSPPRRGRAWNASSRAG
jgi:hypothetical protein